jgi:geranylgeranyl pyrophosphate synthase
MQYPKTKSLYPETAFVTSSWSDPIREEMAMVEIKLREIPPGEHQMLSGAIQGLFNAGGKRIRPSLCLLTAGLFNADIDHAIYLSAAVEMLHTATLVHDDLIDGAMLRRGAPTLNSFWSSDIAVLSGDYLFARAASMVSEVEIVPIMKLFASTLETILNGEITQKFSKWQIDRNAYADRIYAKTAALFVLATQSAALLGGADRDSIDAFINFGYSMGMAFQIVDDILDYIGTPEKLGKPIGGDLHQGLFTLPAIYYAENNPQDEDMDTLHKSKEADPSLIQRLIAKIQSSGAIEASLQEAQTTIKNGQGYLSVFPASRYKDALFDLTKEILHRDF